MSAEGGGSASLAPWLIGALSVVLVVVLVVVFVPQGGQAPAGAASGMEGFTGNMRADADRLFNRVMAAAEQGDEGQVAQFMPMAIQAYEMVENIDDDGLFHLGLLHLTAGSPDQAVEAADRILTDQPDHLLGLAVAAQAAEANGDAAAAVGYWQRYLDAYDTEAGKPLPAYVDHQPILPEYRQMAEDALAGP